MRCASVARCLLNSSLQVHMQAGIARLLTSSMWRFMHSSPHRVVYENTIVLIMRRRGDRSAVKHLAVRGIRSVNASLPVYLGEADSTFLQDSVDRTA